MGMPKPRGSTHARRRVLASGVVVLLLALAACNGSSATAHSTATTTPLSSATSSPTAAPTATSIPGSQATWTSLQNVPSYVASFRFEPADPANGYLCALNGPAVSPLPFTPRLYKTSDSGKTWRPISAPVISPIPDGGVIPAVFCRLFVDDTFPSDVFLQEAEIDPAGAGHAIARALYRSQDGGASWKALATVSNTDGFDSLIVAGGRLVARIHPSVNGASPCDPSVKPTAYSNLYGSGDGGASWQPIGQDIESQGYLLIAVADAVPAVNCSQQPSTSTFWQSADGGVTWQKTGRQAGFVSALQLAFRAKPESPHTYCGVATTSNFDAAGYNHEAILYWDGGSSGWRQLPALPAQYADELAVTPTCTVLAQVSAQSGSELGIFAIEPEVAAPAWSLYAAGGSMDWQITGAQTYTLWARGGQQSEEDTQTFYQPEYLPVS